MVLRLAREEPEAGPWRAEPLQVTVRLGAADAGLSSCRARRSARTEATPLPVNSQKRELEKVNCVVPSIIDTPANRSAMPDADHASWPKIPDIAQAYLFLASPAAGLVSGAAVPV